MAVLAHDNQSAGGDSDDFNEDIGGEQVVGVDHHHDRGQRQVHHDAVKAELIHQRAIEFFVEGERFYDLRRWGLLEEKLKEQDPTRSANFSSKFLYFPIPAKEIQTNELCTPSEGW